MIRFLFISIYLFITAASFSQDFDYFDKKRDYVYKTLYIDSIGDTIIKETLTLRVLDRRWIAQLGLQKSIRYIYETDTVAYKNYVDPHPYFRERNAKKYNKKGEFPLSKKETTGGYQNEHSFYMHPPRANQYRMLFYAAHPRFHSCVLEKGKDTISYTMQKVPLLGYFNQKYKIKDIGKTKFLGDLINVYQVNVNSFLVPKKELSKEELDSYASTLYAIFSFEYGFLKMHYEFKNGVRIEFNLTDIVDK